MTKTYYLSKYALSKGVQALECLDRYYSGADYVKLDGYGWYWFEVGKDAHETEAAAKAAAESMRLKKIDSLKKQIAKLEKLKF